MKNLVDEMAKEFSAQSHGSSDLHTDRVFACGEKDNEFVPLSYLLKKKPEIKDLKNLKAYGFVASSLDYLELSKFEAWWQAQFNRKLFLKDRKEISIIHYPDNKKIFDAVEIVHQMYQVLKDHNVLMNGKNLPIQLGEWYAKTIFGLDQKKSSSQRGFDFFIDEKMVEVKIHWHDSTSPKGVKLKKSLIEMSDYTIIMYVAKSFRIRDILFLDSDYIIRKFAQKGHTIFLKDQDILSYFFSKSNKHYSKIINKTALLQFATPALAMNIDERLEKKDN